MSKKKNASYYRGAMEGVDQVFEQLRLMFEETPKSQRVRRATIDDIAGAVECIYTDFNVENAKRLGDWPI
jgi:hypothetical protein